MTIHHFAIPALRPEPAQSELNASLAAARVLALRRAFVADGAESFWAVCVEVAHGPALLPPTLRAPGGKGGAGRSGAAQVDHKQLLSDADFAGLRNHNHRDNRWNDNGFRLALSLCAPGSARRTRRHLVRAIGSAKRKGPGGLVGKWPGSGPRRTSPGNPARLTGPRHVD
ncbi:hypothetical protein [Derxia lacustris]|uniref:hypothetical protein n=1 Tax=Derxia lacustris TaxID=764842 RepID=UPI000A17740F|nr:hypothetical protein [Derxia lacustris]